MDIQCLRAQAWHPDHLSRRCVAPAKLFCPDLYYLTVNLAHHNDGYAQQGNSTAQQCGFGKFTLGFEPEIADREH